MAGKEIVTENMKRVYMDNAATTMLLPEAFEAMKPYLLEDYENPSGVYRKAQQNLHAIDEARDVIAEALHASGREIYFTSGGSESDNWAIKGIAQLQKKKGNHIITTCIEHHAVLRTCEYLEKQGYEVTYLKVDENGLISIEELKEAIRPTTILISIMFANNEIGTIQPIEQIGALAKEHQILFHTDAVQAFGHVPIDVENCHIDLLSASAHKFHGPKGTGFLYVREGIPIGALIHGGAQEQFRRGGTYNTPGIVGMGVAAKCITTHLQEYANEQVKLRDYAIERILKEIPDARLNGDRKQRLPNNLNFSFESIVGESLLIMLDQCGIYASSGSACTSGSLDPSHVLLALGLSDELARGSIRLSISHFTTKEEMDYVTDTIKTMVNRLRNRYTVC